MQPAPPVVTDLERGGGFYALLFFGFWAGVAVFMLGKAALEFFKEQAQTNKASNDRQIEMMAKQINDGREQVDKLIAAFQRSLDLHEAEKNAQRRARK